MIESSTAANWGLGILLACGGFTVVCLGLKLLMSDRWTNTASASVPTDHDDA